MANARGAAYSSLTSNLSRGYGSTSETRVPDVSYSGSQFSPTEMYDLSENITSNIYAINASWKLLEQSLKLIGTSRESKALREEVHETQSSSNKKIAETTKNLQRLSTIVRRGDKHQRLRVDKLTNNFKEAVQKYIKVQKQVAEKIRMCLFQSEEFNKTEEPKKSEEEQLMISKQQMLTRDLQFEQEILIEREQTITELEVDILDFNQIMKELGALVHEQREAVDSIENSIETVYGNVEGAEAELEKASTYQNSRRRKTCILLGIAAAVGTFIALVIILSLSLK